MEQRFTNDISDHVYRYLIDMILSLQIKPGDRIPEAGIAQQFGISRTPIREALRELAKDGIIHIYPNRFSEVAVYDPEMIREVGLTKTYLDRLSVKLAAYYGSRADFNELRTLAKKCYVAAESGDVRNRIKGDSEYHWALCSIGKNRSLLQLSSRLIVQVEYLQAANYLEAEEAEVQYRCHTQIVDALEEGNVERALRLITEPSIGFYNLKDVPTFLYQ